MRIFSVTLLLACAGCATTGVLDENYPTSPVRQRIEAALPVAAETALTTPKQVPFRHELSHNGRNGLRERTEYTEQSFRYSFRLVQHKDDWYVSREKSWALPVEEHPRVIRSVCTDLSAAIEAGGGKIIESQCDDSTFLIRYESAIRGKPVTGTIHGSVGPEDVNDHEQPLKVPFFSVISVEVREETERRW